VRLAFTFSPEASMAKSRRTFQKTQREMEKKRKAQQKRDDRGRKKDFVPHPEPKHPVEKDSETDPAN
jgi:hypothetical protein